MATRDLIGKEFLFVDRGDAGRRLAAALEGERGPEVVVVGLARGGVEVAAEVARGLETALDVVPVRKIRHPRQPEYALGAVTPGDGVHLRGPDGLDEDELAAVVEAARRSAARLDQSLHAADHRLDLADKTVVVVDDGLATGATMIAALRWAREAGALRVVAAVPVAPPAALAQIVPEADEVVCLHPRADFFAVGSWYESFDQLDDKTVMRLIAENRKGARP
jgi:predicted phosphoribosyltransferase